MISVLVTNCDYSAYVVDAVQSALAQTREVGEIVVVDDGSVDDSVARLRSRYEGEPRVRVLAQPHAGQLAAFNAGFAAARGDVVFFLDADDAYEPEHVARVMQVFSDHPSVGFVGTAYRLVGGATGLRLASGPPGGAGYSALRTGFGDAWLGSVTSALALRRSVLERILPYNRERDWRIRADDCLVLGASLVGARKYFLAEARVRYRVHGRNRFFGRGQDIDESYAYFLARMQLVRDFQGGLHSPVGAATLLVFEAQSVERYRWCDFCEFVTVLWRVPDGFYAKQRAFLSLVKRLLVRRVSLSENVRKTETRS